MAESWRVVLASGEVREVVTESGDDGHRCAVGGNYHGWGTTPPAAIAAVVGMHGWPVIEILAPGEPTRAELAARLAAVTAERDVLRAQQAPLLDAHDALVAAARAAGWTGAGATGAELVAWVRREEREACARIADTAAEAAKVRALGIGKRALESMLATARREGAEAMRAKCLGRLEEMLDELHENGAGRDAAAQALTDAHEYMRSSLCRIDDAPGGAT